MQMHPAFWPMQAMVFWLDVLMLPWKMTIAPVTDSMQEVTAATNPAAVAGLEPVSPHEIGTSATNFSERRRRVTDTCTCSRSCLCGSYIYLAGASIASK